MKYRARDITQASSGKMKGALLDNAKRDFTRKITSNRMSSFHSIFLFLNILFILLHLDIIGFILASYAFIWNIFPDDCLFVEAVFSIDN